MSEDAGPLLIYASIYLSIYLSIGFSTVAVEWLKRHGIPFIHDVAVADDSQGLRKAG